MSVDVHEACQGRLNQFLQAQEARRQMESSYDSALAEFQEDISDVFDVCGTLEQVDEEAGTLLDELYNNPLTDTVATPRFWGDLLEIVALAGPFGVGCLIEIAGVMQSESSFRVMEEQMNQLKQEEESARRAYVGCLRQAGFQESRR